MVKAMLWVPSSRNDSPGGRWSRTSKSGDRPSGSTISSLKRRISPIVTGMGSPAGVEGSDVETMDFVISGRTQISVVAVKGPPSSAST